MKTKEYEVLVDTKEVAGVRNPGKGETIELTDLQAEHPLRTGTVKRASEKKA